MGTPLFPCMATEGPSLLAEEASRGQFRDYEADRVNVRDHYRQMRAKQTVAHVERMQKLWTTFERPMLAWEAMEALNDLVDLSDPDLDLPNIQHLFQSAEAVRAAGRPEWMQVTALIHDLGKVMFRFGNTADGTSQESQYSIVGDTFVVGCAIPDACVYPEFNALNPDMQDERYNTPLGMYSAKCGLDNLKMAWGHDEYLYQVLKNHPDNTLPQEAMWMIRYHSFYPWHSSGAYQHLLAESDEKILQAIRDFNQFDLYSKDREAVYDVEEMKARYVPLLERFLGKGPIKF